MGFDGHFAELVLRMGFDGHFAELVRRMTFDGYFAYLFAEWNSTNGWPAN
jgi:type IV secretory pathway TrbL component